MIPQTTEYKLESVSHDDWQMRRVITHTRALRNTFAMAIAHGDMPRANVDEALKAIAACKAIEAIANNILR
jgi:hypothetical protein